MAVVENNKVTFREPPVDFDWVGAEDDKKAGSAEQRATMEKAYRSSTRTSQDAGRRPDDLGNS